MITFNHDHFNGNLAYIIENDVLLFAILKEVEKNSNIVIQNGAKIDKIQLESESGKTNEIHLTTGESFSAELLVSSKNKHFYFIFKYKVLGYIFADFVQFISKIDLDFVQFVR